MKAGDIIGMNSFKMTII